MIINMNTYWRTTEQWSRGNLNGISERLVTALDAIGFSEKTRETVTDYAVLHGILYNMFSVLFSSIHCHATMGSQQEGTTNYMLMSDNDVIHYSPLLRIFETVKLKTNCPFNTHLITVNDSCIPIGYTKIQLVQNGKIVLSETEVVGNENNDIYPFEKFKFDEKGRFVLSNEFNRFSDTKIHSRNGPADTISHNCRMSFDMVRSYMFEDIPKAMLPWFSRSRSQGWPSKETLKLCKRMGCFVVPVGQANSEERNLEWRFSMSFQEQHLMLNLNEAQYKCYILLKLIKKFLINPRFGDILSSYHCKTCLFYTIEKFGTWSWTTKTLLRNLIRCLEQMLHWIKACFCPNYFVPDENMFAQRLNKHNQHGIRMYIENLIKTNCVDLVEIKFMKFGSLVSTPCDVTKNIMNTFLINEIFYACNAHTALYMICKYGISYEHAYDLDLTQQKHAAKCHNIVKSYELGDTVEAEKFKTISNSNDWAKCAKDSLENDINFMYFCQKEIEKNINGKTILRIELAMKYIFDTFSNLKQSLLHQKGLKPYKIRYIHCREKELVLKAIQLARAKVFTDIASACVAEYIRTKTSELLFKSVHYFEKGKAVNYFTNRLKFARLLFIRQMYGQCQSLLNQLVIIEKETIHTCICHNDNLNKHNLAHSIIFKLTYHKDTLSLWNEQNEENRTNMRAQLIANNFTNCVVYDYYELEAINAPLFYEAFRSFGTPTNSKVFLADYWFSRAVFDPVVYLHFMLIDCIDQLNSRGGSAASLEMLEHILIINFDNSLWHHETALNLLGYLYVKKGWTKLAQECFRKSLNVRPLHNAAKWHIMFMLFGL